jgi:hypothetical protein
MAVMMSEFCSQLVAANDKNAQLARDGGGGDMPWELLTPHCRLRVGLFLCSLKEQSVTCLLTVAAWKVRTHTEPQKEDADGIMTPLVPEDLPICVLYHAIVDKLDLDGCWWVHPHLNGKDVIKELGLQNGPQVDLYIKDQTRWMLLKFV